MSYLQSSYRDRVGSLPRSMWFLQD